MAKKWFAVFATGQSVRPEGRTRTDYDSQSVQSWKEFCPGLMAGGRGNLAGPTKFQNVSECVAR